MSSKAGPHNKVAAAITTFRSLWSRGCVGLLAAVTAILLVAPLGETALSAQQAENFVRVDSIVVVGNSRVSYESILAALAFGQGDNIVVADLPDGIKDIFSLGQFRDVEVYVLGGPTEGATVVFKVEEQPLLRRVVIRGLEHADAGEVRDSVGLNNGEPFSEHEVLRAREMLRAALADEGIPFATLTETIEPVDGLDNVVDLIIDVNEGSRVGVADVVIRGNQVMSTDEIIGAMETRPEGFWWFRSGGFEETSYELDLLQRIPQIYLERGYLDFSVLADTIIVDPSTGKARIELDVEEGPQYRIARFTIEGNSVFDDEVLESFFLEQEGGLLRSLGIGGGEQREIEQRGRVFDQIAFEEGISQIQQLYRNEGYLFSNVLPGFVKSEPTEPGGQHTVVLTVQVQEGSRAFLNVIAIDGNDYTHEWVIRDQIRMLPGGAYSEADVIGSMQSIQALGFFETPLPLPEIDPNPGTGEVDVTFHVVERQTGAINFGTSVGGGVGLSGFIGYDQPNLFGQAKQGHLRWDFGRYLNNFTVSFTDPALFQSRISGTLTLFDSRDRFFQFQSGERNRLGASVRFGFPIPGWTRTRFFTGYSISRTKYETRAGVDDTSLFGLPPGTQSQISVGLTRTTLNHPVFPSAGSRQTITVETNGGLLGGDGNFQRVLADGTWRVPITSPQAGAVPGAMTFSLGLAVRGGMLFGDASDFPFDRFWMGGVNFGQQLRGYDETSITPLGYFQERSGVIRDISRLGDAFLSLTADYAMKLNDNIQLTAFYDAGNVWRNPSDVDPTKLFRGAGFGLQLVTPFGPIGVDYAYGFDRDRPGWKFHFKMGPGF